MSTQNRTTILLFRTFVRVGLIGRFLGLGEILHRLFLPTLEVGSTIGRLVIREAPC